jgi:hypothetical protein
MLRSDVTPNFIPDRVSMVGSMSHPCLSVFICGSPASGPDRASISRRGSPFVFICVYLWFPCLSADRPYVILGVQ